MLNLRAVAWVAVFSGVIIDVWGIAFVLGANLPDARTIASIFWFAAMTKMWWLVSRR